jgi:hypothetical protein
MVNEPTAWQGLPGQKAAEYQRLFVGGETLGPETVTKTKTRMTLKKVKRIMQQVEEEVEVEEQVDGQGQYTIVNPHRLYLGRSYSDWISDWFNWYVSVDADKRNSGPVVFLRSQGLPNKTIEDDILYASGESARSDALTDSFGADPNYPKLYPNNPNIRVGSDRLQIFEDQAVLVPIINAYELATVPYRDWGSLQGYTGPTIDYGDNPPDVNQLTINKHDIRLPQFLGMRDFRIITPVFTAIIPEAEYGRSIKDYLEVRVTPGQYAAIVEGYFVMLKFAEGSYWIHSFASGPREYIPGPYYAELLYQIEVHKRADCDPHGRISVGRPSRNEHFIKKTLFRKKEIGELKSPEINRYEMY